eukprot:9156693-Pyramimonas_sp.AAC.1
MLCPPTRLADAEGTCSVLRRDWSMLRADALSSDAIGGRSQKHARRRQAARAAQPLMQQEMQHRVGALFDLWEEVRRDVCVTPPLCYPQAA